ncbi:MAG: RagB/SusD family nutrient uptake outer membrane protein, partial [Mariniphaga sp.]|nr:RagB/SusD family nutrient uptake outer membrane protein [Mariniphaga sp.]
MKKIKLSFGLLFIFMFAQFACNEETIELLPIGNTEGTYFQDEKHMEEAIMGVYQKLAFFYAFRGGQNNNCAPIWHLPGDDLTTLANFAFEDFVGLNGSSGQLSLFYNFSYQLIARANIMLQKIKENGDFAYEKQPELKDYHKGEALFLKAYTYFMLWNVFGTAPLVPERITKIDDAYPPNSEGTQLLDEAINHLEEAKSLLPDSWSAAYKGRVTKNSARGLRGKCLVFRGSVNNTAADFTEAITEFNAITGVSLATNYNQNFDVKFENNVESLFEYQANSSPGNVNPYVGGAGGNDAFSVIGEIGHYIGMFTQSPSWIGNSHFTATPSLRGAYEDGDPRVSYILKPESEGLINVIKYAKSTAWATNGQSNGISTNNPRILRYADVLLLKAEAIVRSGGSLNDAIELINEVRERARNSTETGGPAAVPADRNVAETNTATVLEWIFEERRLELA